MWTKASEILVTCPKAMPPYLAAEIEALGLPVLAELPAGVATRGTLADCMRLNLELCTGHRVLYRLLAFKARDPEELYARLCTVPWEECIPADGYVSVASSVFNDFIRDTRFATFKCKDAIVDRIRAKRGRRPDSGPEQRGAAVFLHWQGEDAQVYLNTSGEPLARRGYRKMPHRAPLQESLAAGCLAASGWDAASHFVNPMCGSGTLAIEAALRATQRAPGLTREEFAFMHLLGFDAAAWKKLLNRTRGRVKRTLPLRIVATDRDPRAIEAARTNALAAGVDEFIEFSVCDFARTPLPDEPGMVMLNPEYGERLGEEKELGATYAAIGDFFKAACQGWTGCIFTGNPGLAKQVGLRTRRKIPFFNAKIECRLLIYELYAGSRKGGAEEGPGSGAEPEGA